MAIKLTNMLMAIGDLTYQQLQRDSPRITNLKLTLALCSKGPHLSHEQNVFWMNEIV